MAEAAACCSGVIGMNPPGAATAGSAGAVPAPLASAAAAEAMPPVAPVAGAAGLPPAGGLGIDRAAAV